MGIKGFVDLREKPVAQNSKTSGIHDRGRILEERPPLGLTPEKKWNDSSEMARSPGIEAQHVHRIARSLKKTAFPLCNTCPVPMGTMRNFSMAKSLFPGTVNRSVCTGLFAHFYHCGADRQVASVPGSHWAGTADVCPQPSRAQGPFLIP